MNSLNGLVNLLTLNPFESAGLGVQQKTGSITGAMKIEDPSFFRKPV
ncbi:MAG: hypothetical protein R2822_09475 [Spirosomataceae bacterium]